MIKRRRLFTVVLFVSLLFASTALAKGVWEFIGLTGGVKPALDWISVAEIEDGDVATGLDISTNVYRIYEYDSSSSDSESSPTVIKPDDNSGNGRWIQKAYTGSGSGSGIDTYTTVALIEAASGSDNNLAYCVETETLYRYEATGSSYTDNNEDILSTGDGGDTRWIGVSGKYVYNMITSTGGFKVRKVSGTAGKMGVYEANSTDETMVGWQGPYSITAERWYKFPDSDPVNYSVFMLSTPSSNVSTVTHSRLYDAIEFLIDGGGSAISTGVKGDIEIPDDFEIERVTLLADQSGSIQIDIWQDTYANYPPTDADSITGSNTPAISSSTKSQDSSLTGWTTGLTAGSILRFNVDSCTTITRCTISLKGYWKY